MGKWDKFRAAVLSGQSDANIDFVRLCTWLQRIGFEERIVGSHHIFANDGVVEIINLQPGAGGNAKHLQAADWFAGVLGSVHGKRLNYEQLGERGMRAMLPK